MMREVRGRLGILCGYVCEVRRRGRYDVLDILNAYVGGRSIYKGISKEIKEIS